MTDHLVHASCIFFDRKRGDLDERARPIVRDIRDITIDEWDSGWNVIYSDDCIEVDNVTAWFSDLITVIERWGLGGDHWVQVGSDTDNVIEHGRYTGEDIEDRVDVVMTLREYHDLLDRQKGDM